MVFSAARADLMMEGVKAVGEGSLTEVLLRYWPRSSRWRLVERNTVTERQTLCWLRRLAAQASAKVRMACSRSSRLSVMRAKVRLCIMERWVAGRLRLMQGVPFSSRQVRSPVSEKRESTVCSSQSANCLALAMPMPASFWRCLRPIPHTSATGSMARALLRLSGVRTQTPW